MIMGKLSATLNSRIKILDKAIAMAVMAARNVLSLVELLLPKASSKKPFFLVGLVHIEKDLKKVPGDPPGD